MLPKIYMYTHCNIASYVFKYLHDREFVQRILERRLSHFSTYISVKIGHISCKKQFYDTQLRVITDVRVVARVHAADAQE